MVRRIYGKKYLIIIMLIPLVSTPIYGLVQISNSAENVIKNMEPSSLCEFTENGEGTIYSSDGVKLWANDFPGYEDSFSLVGVLRDGVQLSDNTITAKYKKELLAKEKEYNVWQGSSSIANTASDVHITLNHGLNEGLYQYMIDNGATKGTVCAMDVKTGELLAMVSLPATIPSESVDLSSLEDSALVNKNLSVMVPGSTIKIFTTALLYEVGGIDTINNLLFTCDGNYILADHSAVTCGTRRGYKNISAAIGTSCNAFFAYSIRNILDQKSKDTQNKLVDFGFQLLPTKNHYVALDKLLRLQSKTYYSGFGYQSTWSLIGQQSQVSPIDACTLVSAIENEGVSTEPNIIRRISRMDGKETEAMAINTRQLMSKSTANATKIAWKNAFKKYYRGYDSNIVIAKTGTCDIEKAEGIQSNKLLIGQCKRKKGNNVAFFISIEDYKNCDIMPVNIANEMAELLTKN